MWGYTRAVPNIKFPECVIGWVFEPEPHCGVWFFAVGTFDGDDASVAEIDSFCAFCAPWFAQSRNISK